MQEFSTPMMRQYTEIKNQYPDCLLFFRMGDFYELFMEDAHIGSRILSITLTGKSGGKDGRIPMAGVPYHAADGYIAKLVKAGFKVAICEQLSPPNRKGLVKRGVVRIVTPGTLLDEKNLEKKENNYIVSIFMTPDRIGLAASDLSTGFFALLEEELPYRDAVLTTELSRLKPSECILPEELYNNADVLKLLHEEKQMNIFRYSGFPIDNRHAGAVLQKHFGVRTLEGFGVAEMTTAQIPAAALLTYLKETQNGKLSHLKKIVSLSNSDGVTLDRSTMINLELFATIRDSETRGSLLSVIDHTCTAMGGRLLKAWMKKPSRTKEVIEERLDTVTAFCDQPDIRDAVREQLKLIPDVERLHARLSVQLGNARDLRHLKHALETILLIKNLLSSIKTPLIEKEKLAIAPQLVKIVELIESVFVEDPPLTVKDGGMIRSGINSTLDKLNRSIAQSKVYLHELEKTERNRTGINSLKVRFNKVFGFYIEVSKTNLHAVPAEYVRKQTLVNAERFITEELKVHEEIILTAEEKIHALEYKIFSEIVEQILLHTDSIQNSAESIAVIDCLTNFSYVAEKDRYARPKLLYSGEIRIKQGRHPVVEKLCDRTPFVPNDATLDNVSQSLLLITGPNMAGKSVFIRQVALIVLMAQLGSYVPAQSAHISICDKIFVRSGASDVITSGLSTFMVEMVETAHILHNATKDSLIIMDEIGRGTSTYDGISIAWAVAENLVTNHSSPPKVLFATHYHELQSLEEQHPSKIKNFHMAVAEQKGEPIFLHSLLPGGASHSFGLAVAKLAGVPEDVILRAKELLVTLEKRSVEQKPEHVEKDAGETTILMDHLLKKDLQNLNIANMTPLEALNKLAEIKDKLGLLQQEREHLMKGD
jgi:DNA mismatch repair protein MutS